MAKKAKDDVPNPNSVANRDIIQRLNFLYQASVYLNALPSPAPAKRNRKRRVTTDQLARDYVSTMKIVGQKTTVKIDPTVKRTICQNCNTVLVAGTTATVRVKKSSSHGHLMMYTCTHCNETRRIPAPPLKQDVSMGIDRPVGERQPTHHETKPKPKDPPLSLRPDAGHIIFRGQDKVEYDPLLGSGLFSV